MGCSQRQATFLSCVFLSNRTFIYFQRDFLKTSTFLSLGCHVLNDFRRDVLQQHVLPNASLLYLRKTNLATFYAGKNTLCHIALKFKVTWTPKKKQRKQLKKTNIPPPPPEVSFETGVHSGENEDPTATCHSEETVKKLRKA